MEHACFRIPSRPVFSTVNDLVKSANRVGNEIEERLADVREFCRKNRLDPDLTASMRTFCRSYYAIKNDMDSQERILRALTTDMRHKVHYNMLTMSVRNIAVLQSAADTIVSSDAQLNFQMRAMQHLKAIVFPPNEKILAPWEGHEELYFVRNGKVDAFNRYALSKKVSSESSTEAPTGFSIHLFTLLPSSEDGCVCFGERAVLSNKSFQLEAIEYVSDAFQGCELWALSSTSLYELLRSIDDSKAALRASYVLVYNAWYKELRRVKQMWRNLHATWRKYWDNKSDELLKRKVFLQHFHVRCLQRQIRRAGVHEVLLSLHKQHGDIDEHACAAEFAKDEQEAERAVKVKRAEEAADAYQAALQKLTPGFFGLKDAAERVETKFHFEAREAERKRLMQQRNETRRSELSAQSFGWDSGCNSSFESGGSAPASTLLKKGDGSGQARRSSWRGFIHRRTSQAREHATSVVAFREALKAEMTSMQKQMQASMHERMQTSFEASVEESIEAIKDQVESLSDQVEGLSNKLDEVSGNMADASGRSSIRSPRSPRSPLYKRSHTARGRLVGIAFDPNGMESMRSND